MSLFVTETFSSLQGEGAHQGMPCFFIRLSGCNLRCSYCDSDYAWKEGESCTAMELVAMWQKSGIELVQVTGGEPLLQPESLELMQNLLQKGATVLLETNGSLSLADVPKQVIKIVDRKTPGSNMEQGWMEENLRFLTKKDQVKFVITDRTDYCWARQWIAQKCLASFTQVLFSPAWGSIEPVELASWVVEDRLPVRFQLQLHKILWGERRGV